MIRYALVCSQDHQFEGWFGSSSDFDDQQARHLVACPMCESTEVRKAIMAPAVSGTKRSISAEPAAKMQAMMMEAMGQVRRHVEENFDNVGDRFAKEARLIHEGKSEERGIYGEATPKEVRDLVADGVPVAPLPPEAPKKTELN